MVAGHRVDQAMNGTVCVGGTVETQRPRICRNKIASGFRKNDLLAPPRQLLPQISYGFPRFRGFQDPAAISHRGHSKGVRRRRVASRTGAVP
jgi:hypothetical protein